MATTDEQLALVNVHPCTLNEVQKSIGDIVNVINNMQGGFLMGRCTLTSDNMDCAPDLLTVSGFTPLVQNFAGYGVAAPTQARQFLGIATNDARVGYIAYNWDNEEWEVLLIE